MEGTAMANLNDTAWQMVQDAREEAARLDALRQVCDAIRREAGSTDRPSAMSECYKSLKAAGHASCPEIRQAMLAGNRELAATLLLLAINL
jgi:hypothetical protein